MKLRKTSTLDRIATAYAEAVAEGNHEAAEGWIRTASFVAEREKRGGPSPVLVVGGPGGSMGRWAA